MARSKEFEEAAVLEKAVDLFWQQGYHGTSMQEVVDRLGISRSSLYDTFGGKEELFLEAVRKYRLQEGAKMKQVLQEASDVKATIRAILESVTRPRPENNSRRGCFLVNVSIELAPHDPRIQAIVQENRLDMENAFSEFIARGQAEGQISRNLSPQSLARFFFSTINGLQVAARAGADEQSLRDVVEVAMEVV